MEFEKLDKERRGIEYTIHEKALAETRKELELIEARRRAESDTSSQV